MEDDTVLLVAEMWRRRVEWLWNACELTADRPVDIEWLDEQITKDEADARKAPKR